MNEIRDYRELFDSVSKTQGWEQLVVKDPGIVDRNYKTRAMISVLQI